MGRGSVFIVVTAILASLLEIIDTSIVNVAQPRMMGNLGVTLDEISWVSTGYIISNAVVLPIASWLGLKIGRRPYYISCILVFTGMSLFCGIAPSFGFLVFARIVQGAAGGALLPTSQAIIQEQFPGEKSGVGSAIYGMSVMVGPALGPTLGGYLTDNFNWRAIFYINIPIGILAAVLAFLFIPAEEGSKASGRRMDWIGFFLLVVGIGGLQYMLERGQQDDWFSASLILAAAAVAGVGLPLFFLYEYRHEDPIVNVRLFSRSALRSGVALMAATGLVLYSLVFLIPVYTDRQLGMDATHTGYLYIPGSLATMACMPIVGMLMPKVGPKAFILIGIGLICGCLFTLSRFTSSAGTPDLFVPLLLRGMGLGCMFVPINAAVLSQFRGEELGQASGLLNLSRQVGGSMGIAGVQTFLDRYSAQIRNELRFPLGFANPAATNALSGARAIGGPPLASTHGLSSGALGFAQRAAAGLGGLKGRMEAQVLQLSFNKLMALILVVYVVAMLPLFRMKLDKKVTAQGAH